MLDAEEIRKEFPVTKAKVFLNHAGVSPLPKPVSEAMHACLEKSSVFDEYPFDLDDCRRLFAGLVNAQPDEVALVPNTSTGLSIAAFMLKYPSGSNVVTTDLEFPSVVYPWLTKELRLRVEVRYVRNVKGELRIEDFERAIDDRTVAVAVSHVEYANGFRNDLRAMAEVAHEHGAVLVVDACQSAGALVIDVKRDGVDLLSTSCYKWLLGPDGAGFLYVRHDLIAKSEPVFVGWASVKDEVFETLELWDNRQLRLSETASRFETGGHGNLGYVGAAAALRLLLDVGKDKIESRILGLMGHLMTDLKEADFKLQTPEAKEHRSGIVNFLVEDPEEKVARLRERGIIVSARMNGIRVSPHFYNSEEEIEELVEEVKKP